MLVTPGAKVSVVRGRPVKSVPAMAVPFAVETSTEIGWMYAPDSETVKTATVVPESVSVTVASPIEIVGGVGSSLTMVPTP